MVFSWNMMFVFNIYKCERIERVCAEIEFFFYNDTEIDAVYGYYVYYIRMIRAARRYNALLNM